MQRPLPPTHHRNTKAGPRRILVGVLASIALGAGAQAQSNVRPGTDVRLGLLDGFTELSHFGTFPTGFSTFAMNTTACNVGTVDVPWQAPMAEDHPMIAFLVAREHQGRFEQISHYSYVKHGFNSDSKEVCTPCLNPTGGQALGVGCSDTYTVVSNADSFVLGPAEEIDPWLGTWTATCSHFDRGQPAAPPPFDCDGFRSLTQGQVAQMGALGNRMQVQDKELGAPGARYYYQGQYVVLGEPLADRGDNLGSREFSVQWNGTGWDTPTLPSSGYVFGSVLQRWKGAEIAGSANGLDDGQLFAGVRVSSTQAGTYRYEYALHNVDNRRSIGALRLPIAAGATVSNVDFHDLDDDPNNDWTWSVVGGELVFDSGTNPVLWNSIYNIGFDCDAAPGIGSVHLDQFFAGLGSPTVSLSLRSPLGGCPAPEIYCAPKANSKGCLPSIQTQGVPSGSLPGTFSIQASNLINQKTAVLFWSMGTEDRPFRGGTLCVRPPLRRTLATNTGGNPPPDDCSGTVDFDFNAWIQGGNDPFLGAGALVHAQVWYQDPGEIFFKVGLTDAVRFVVCP